MDKRTAREKLKDLRDSLSQILGSQDRSNAEEIKEQAQESIQQAREASKALKKSLVDRVKDFPVVQKVSELGTAGTVAVSTAAVAQTGVAVDQTEVFVANIANDIVEERFEVPEVFNTVLDFEVINNWGQQRLAQKYIEAQESIEQVIDKVDREEIEAIVEQMAEDSSEEVSEEEDIEEKKIEKDIEEEEESSEEESE